MKIKCSQKIVTVWMPIFDTFELGKMKNQDIDIEKVTDIKKYLRSGIGRNIHPCISFVIDGKIVEWVYERPSSNENVEEIFKIRDDDFNNAISKMKK